MQEHTHEFLATCGDGNRLLTLLDFDPQLHGPTGTLRLLFICSQNRLHSPTAEQVFADRPGLETASAGTNRGADNPLSAELVEWADVIFVMEKPRQRKSPDNFKAQLRGKRVVCLGIPDDYEFMQPELVELLEAKVGRYLRR